MLLLFKGVGFAQVNPADSTNSDLNSIIELLETAVEEDASNEDFIGLMEELEYYLAHPININTTSKEEFQAFHFLSDQEVNEILRHRKVYGKFVDINELKYLGLRDTKIQLLKPYLTLSGSNAAPFETKKVLANGRHDLFLRFTRVLESQDGYQGDTPSYSGNPNKYFMRYRYLSGRKLSLGFTLEKDAGEEFFEGSNGGSIIQPYQGFDYSSGHIYIRPGKVLTDVAIGDYSLNWGQGLAAWNGLAFRKSAYTFQAKKEGPEIRPYTSVNEFSFFRGGAIRLSLGHWRMISFVSSKKVDGNIVTAIDDDLGSTVSSIQISGLHRTSSEISDENSINEFMTGFRLGRNLGRFGTIGFNAVHISMDPPFQKRDALYSQFEFAGSQLQNYSLDYKYVRQKYQLFGENAVNSEGETALINGAIAHINPRLDAMLIHRSYSRGYTAFYANAFGERTVPSNENGIYFAIQFRPFDKWEIQSYADLYEHPWLRFGVDAPSSGRDYLIQANYDPSNQVQMYLRFKHETKQDNFPENETASDFLEFSSQTRLRYHVQYDVTYYLNIKSRVEYTWLDNGVSEQRGLLLFQDFQYRFKRLPLKITARIAIFDTDSFQSAIYAYENDVLYSFSIPAYFNQGTRFYLLAKYQLKKNIDFWIRYAQFNYVNQSEIGSGPERIMGNTKSDIRLQCRIRL